MLFRIYVAGLNASGDSRWIQQSETKKAFSSTAFPGTAAESRAGALSQKELDWNLAEAVTNWVTLGVSLTLSEPHMPHEENKLEKPTVECFKIEMK